MPASSGAPLHSKHAVPAPATVAMVPPLRVSVLGSGNFGSALVTKMRNSGVEVVLTSANQC